MRHWIMSTAVLMATACGQSAKQPDSGADKATANTGGSAGSAGVDSVRHMQEKAIALAKAADQALEDSVRLDYRRPELNSPVQRDNVRKAYWEACQAGDHRSCWTAQNIRDLRPVEQQFLPDAQALIRSACQAGDLMSCRTITDGPWIARHWESAKVAAGSGSDAPCPAGDTCAMLELRRECELGFPNSCQKLALSSPPDERALRVMTTRLTRAGCKAGIVDECHTLFSSANERSDMTDADYVEISADLVLSGNMLCALWFEHCEDVWRAYRSTDLKKARDALERSCQLTALRTDQLESCSFLTDSYTDETKTLERLPEPAPGRGKELSTWWNKHRDER